MRTGLQKVTTGFAALTGRQLGLGLGVALLALLLAPAVPRIVTLAGLGHHGSGQALADDPVCGNGIVETGEQCDDGDNNGVWSDCCTFDCRFKAADDGCDDNDGCTGPDTCDGRGHCVGQSRITVCPGDECHDDIACDPRVGCANPQKPDGTPCDDNDACTLGDQCVSGACMGTDPDCGDGIVQSCEQCDDGNTRNHDGCNAQCNFEESVLSCERTISNVGLSLVGTRLRFIQKCRDSLDRGRPLYFDRERTQPLTDPVDCPYWSKAAFWFQRRGINWHRFTHCTDTAVGLLSVCADTVDGLITDTGDGGCLVDTVAAGVDSMIGQEYGDLSSGDKELQKCQRVIAQAGMHYALTYQRVVQGCRIQLINRRRVFFDEAKQQPLTDPADCPNEYNAHNAIAAAGVDARATVAKSCNDALLTTLAPCATTLDELVSPDGSSGCLITGHASAIDTIIDAES